MSFGGGGGSGGPGISFDGVDFSSAPSAPSAPSVSYSAPSVDSFDMGGGQTISIDPAGNVTQDGVGYSPSIPGTNLSLEPTVAGMLAYQDLTRAAQQQAALEQYQMAQVLAPELQASLFDEQARGTTAPAVEFTPDGAMAEQALNDQAIENSRAYGTALGSPTGAVTFDPIFGDYYGLSKYGPAIARDPSGNALFGQTILGNIPYMGIGAAARGFLGGASPFSGITDFFGGLSPDQGDWGEFPGDAVSPSLPDMPPAAPPVATAPDAVPDVVAAPTPSQVFANSQAFYRPTLLDQAPAGMPGFDAANRQFNLSSALRPDIYNSYNRDLLGRQGYVPL